jgi:hypothetical protein
MIKNFDKIKKELSDLAGIINSFKSEAVQLRIVDLILQGSEVQHDDDNGTGQGSPTDGKSRRRRKGKKKSTPATDKSVKTRGKAGRTGAASILTQLIEEGFFQSKKTIKAIMEHAGKKKARKFKANELSGPLARFVRDGRLDRDENKDGQYEYFKK